MSSGNKLALATSLADGDANLAKRALALTRNDRAHWASNCDSGTIPKEVSADWKVLTDLKFGCNKKLKHGLTHRVL
jgi:hypothetical protein